MSASITPLEDAVQQLELVVQLHAERNGGLPEDWASSAKQRLDDLATVFYQRTIPRHAEEFAQIREEDVALQPRIKQLQEEDREIVGVIEDLQSLAESWDESGERKSPETTEFVSRVHSLIQRIREQRKSITKWFSEAFLRDRGFPSG